MQNATGEMQVVPDDFDLDVQAEFNPDTVVWILGTDCCSSF
ncbi:hypothetical protein ACWEVP_10300 [Amycolatopsis sp. NPDC003865]